MISNVSTISSNYWLKVLLFFFASSLIREASLLSITTIDHLRFMNLGLAGQVYKILASILAGFPAQMSFASLDYGERSPGFRNILAWSLHPPSFLLSDGKLIPAFRCLGQPRIPVKFFHLGVG
jgi:hypothetical protein